MLAACGSNDGKPCMNREIPYSKQVEATEYIQGLMKTIVVASRNDNEDWDDFITAAHHSAMEIYGEELPGILVVMPNTYDHCDCEKARAKAQ